MRLDIGCEFKQIAGQVTWVVRLQCSSSARCNALFLHNVDSLIINFVGMY